MEGKARAGREKPRELPGAKSGELRNGNFTGVTEGTERLGCPCAAVGDPRQYMHPQGYLGYGW